MSELEESAGRELVVELLRRLAHQREIDIDHFHWEVDDHDDEYKLVFVAGCVTSQMIVPFEDLADAPATNGGLDAISERLRVLLDRPTSNGPRKR
jgi:hypothetical protein